MELLNLITPNVTIGVGVVIGALVVLNIIRSLLSYSTIALAVGGYAAFLYLT